MLKATTMIIAFLVIMITPTVLHFGFKLEGKKMKYTLVADMICFALMCVASVVIFANGGIALAAGEAVADNTNAFGYISAALATGLACLGAGIAVASSATAAIGAISEDPKVMGKTLIFVALAEGIALYGLLISFTIIGSLG